MTSRLTVNTMAPLLYDLESVFPETHDTFTMGLKSRDGSSGFSFAPGQFNMLYVFGVGESPISISGDPSNGGVLVHTIRAVGPVTSAISAMNPGDSIGVRGPFGTGWPMEEAAGRDVVIIAGGIGLAPLRPVLYELSSNRGRYGKIALLYGTRTPVDFLYRRELEEWRSDFDMDLDITVDRSRGTWGGSVGVVTTLIPKADFDPQKALAMICGPEVMMRYSIEELVKLGMGKDSIYVSMERNMKCGFGVCGHCQFGPYFVCKDGPVFRYDRVYEFFSKKEV